MDRQNALMDAKFLEDLAEGFAAARPNENGNLEMTLELREEIVRRARSAARHLKESVG